MHLARQYHRSGIYCLILLAFCSGSIQAQQPQDWERIAANQYESLQPLSPLSGAWTGETPNRTDQTDHTDWNACEVLEFGADQIDYGWDSAAENADFGSIAR